MKENKNTFAYGQSGVQGFFGVTKLFEYPYQKIYQYIPGYDFSGCTFVSKTVTLHQRLGNTELHGFKIKHWLPKSIYVSWRGFLKGYMLNAVGLSNPGLISMLQEKIWQQRNNFFHFSLQLETGSEEKLREDLKREIRQITDHLSSWLKHCNYALQLNESCPNTGHAMDTGIESIKYKLSLFREYMPDLKIWIKFNALISPKVLAELQPHCAGFVVSNTIPFDEAPDRSDWKKLFAKGSPLPKRLGDPKILGGLSGLPVYPILIDFLKDVQQNYAEHNLQIIAGGGVFKKRQIEELATFKEVVGVSPGCVVVLRPMRVQSLIKHINKIFSLKKTNTDETSHIV